MIAELLLSAQQFLVQTQEYRDSAPITTNSFGTAALSANEDTKCNWWVVRDGNKVVGCAMHVAGEGFGVSSMSVEAAEALAKTVAATDCTFPSIHGPKVPATAFMERFSSLRSLSNESTTNKTVLLYTIDTLIKPTCVNGQFRLVTNDDLDLVVEWIKAYNAESEPNEIFDHLEYASGKIRDSLFYFWTFEGKTVALAGHSVVASGFARIVPVYTPPQHRRKGYASAITAFVTEMLQSRGVQVMLFADGGYEASNAVYQKLGFVLHCEYIDYWFAK